MHVWPSRARGRCMIVELQQLSAAPKFSEHFYFVLYHICLLKSNICNYFEKCFLHLDR